MRLFIHTLIMTSFVWMTWHLWRQLPVREEEGRAGRTREFVEWVGKGLVVPILMWFLMNLGLATWLPPILPEVGVARNAGGFWLWPTLNLSSPAMSVIATYWSALSLMGMVWMIGASTEDWAGFRSNALIWSGLMLPVSAVIVWIGGWPGAGVALALWFAVVVWGTLPNRGATKRPPSYAQAIARIKFGKYPEAEWEVIRELEQHESDFNGWMMLAELYAVHFHDFEQAQTIGLRECARVCV